MFKSAYSRTAPFKRSVKLKMKDKQTKSELLEVSQSSLFQTLVCNTAFMQQIGFLNVRKLFTHGV